MRHLNLLFAGWDGAKAYPAKRIFMLSLNRVKELIRDETLSDDKAEEIRDEMRWLVEFIFQKIKEDKK